MFGVGLSALMSAVETGSYCLNRIRLRLRVERGDRRASWLMKVMDRQEDMLMVTLAGNSLADYVTTASVTAVLVHAGMTGGRSELIATAIVTPLLLVFGGIIPKTWSTTNADRLMYPLAATAWVAITAARSCGFAGAMKALSRWTLRLVNAPPRDSSRDAAPRTRILQMLHEGALRGGLSEEQSGMMERVLNLSNVPVSRVMIPRARSAHVRFDLPREDFLRIARMAHFSRMPVYRGDPSRMIGIINVYDVLTDDRKRPIQELVRPALQLSMNEPVPSALVRLQEARQAMAIVVDGRGACIGILTVKDLVEEIVGELAVW